MTNDLLRLPDSAEFAGEERFKRFDGTRALVTGGLGFIGSNIVRTLTALGCGVTVLDALAPEMGGNRFNLRGIEDKIDLRIADIRDEAAVQDAVHGRDYVFNMAASVSHLDSLDAPFHDLDINGRGTLTLLEAVRRRAPEARVVHAGTRSEYGLIQSTPVSELHPLLPTEVNSANKALATLYQFAYHVAHGLHTVTLRLTNSYGPRMLTAHHRQGFINWFVRQAVEGSTIRLYGDGSQVRDLVYVDDVVHAFLLAAVTNDATGQTLNIGSGNPVSLRQIAEELVSIAQKGGIEYAPFPDDARRIEIGDYVADTTAIERVLNWRPKVGLREGLERSVLYFQAYREHYGW